MEVMVYKKVNFNGKEGMQKSDMLIHRDDLRSLTFHLTIKGTLHPALALNIGIGRKLGGAKSPNMDIIPGYIGLLRT